ncbi:proteinaceous rnase p 1, chloroplasticmitochondrial, partial [Nicotiana attenuata]
LFQFSTGTTATPLSGNCTMPQDRDMAFDLVKQMNNFGILSRLRPFGPALLGICEKGMAEKAGVVPEEAELSALLNISSESKKGRESISSDA